MHILVVEDEEHFVRFLKRGLEEAGYTVDTALDGAAGLALAARQAYQLVLLDVNLAGGPDGVTVCRALRRANSNLPILLMTALSNTAHKVAGLEAGADDYLVKPFAFAELLARVQALIRRAALAAAPLRLLDLELDPVAHTARRGTTPLALTSREFALLELLLRHPGQVLSHQQLKEHVWNQLFPHSPDVVDTYMSFLRQKVDDSFDQPLIEVVPGRGYRLGMPAAASQP